MAIRESEHPDLHHRIQEQNLLRQYDLLSNCIEIGVEKGIDSFDKYTLWALNYAAVANICQLGGRYREGPIYVGNHIPPHFRDVSQHMDQLFSLIHENWDVIKSPTTLAAYTLWRLNWIHPFIEGNGRTARAACYYLICVRHGRLQRWSCIFDQNAAQLRWIRVSHQAAIFIGSVLLVWTSSGVNMPWVEWGRSAL
jgi:fido (protein-threonine AMPylation protein)